jgi:hypothetical protein
MKFLQPGIKFNLPFMLGLSDRTKVYVLGAGFLFIFLFEILSIFTQTVPK